MLEGRFDVANLCRSERPAEEILVTRAIGEIVAEPEAASRTRVALDEPIGIGDATAAHHSAAGARDSGGVLRGQDGAWGPTYSAAPFSRTDVAWIVCRPASAVASLFTMTPLPTMSQLVVTWLGVAGANSSNLQAL